MPAQVVLTGTGLMTPVDAISNAELAASLAAATTAWNNDNAEAIESGQAHARTMPDE